MSLLICIFGLCVVTWWFNLSLLCGFLLMMMFCCMFRLDGLSFSGLSWCFGGDLMSWGMLIISFWIIFLMYLAGKDYFGGYAYFYSVVLVFMVLFLFFSFMVCDLFMFYVSFESVLIPTLVLIVGWGYQPERLKAGLYMLFYTLFASLPLLMCLLGIYWSYGSLHYFVLVDFSVGGFWVVALFLAFLVKLPIYFLHLWLPRAHVEAPVSGSMVLAGVLLKLGGYGLFRIFFLIKNFIISDCGYLMSLGLIGGLVTSLICLGQVDMKMIVAYSSVVHMSLVLGGFATCSFLGCYGGFVMMLAHGLCSSCLFCLVNVLYERFHSRSVMMISGMLMFFPSLGMWWFMLCVCNMSAPPSYGLVGELILLIGLVHWNFLMMFVLCFMSFFSAVFSLYLYNVVQHGSGWFVMYGGEIEVREYAVFFFHWLPLNFMFIGVSMWSEWL